MNRTYFVSIFHYGHMGGIIEDENLPIMNPDFVTYIGQFASYECAKTVFEKTVDHYRNHQLYKVTIKSPDEVDNGVDTIALVDMITVDTPGMQTIVYLSAREEVEDGRIIPTIMVEHPDHGLDLVIESPEIIGKDECPETESIDVKSINAPEEVTDYGHLSKEQIDAHFNSFWL